MGEKGMEIYTSLDCLADISSVVKLDKPVVVMDIDVLAVKIWNHRQQKVGIDTIKHKLRKLAKAGYIKIITSRKCEYGICYSERSRVIIYRSRILAELKFTKTIELKPQQTLLNYLQR